MDTLLCLFQSLKRQTVHINLGQNVAENDTRTCIVGLICGILIKKSTSINQETMPQIIGYDAS